MTKAVDETAAKRQREIERNLEELNRWYQHKDRLKAEYTRGLLVGTIMGGVIGVFGALVISQLVTM